MIIRHGWQGQIGLLSPREVEFTMLVAAGMTDKEIAREAGLAPDSVRKRIANAMFKLGASRRAHLVAEAIRKAIIAPLALLLAVCCISVGGQPDTHQDRYIRNSVTRTRPSRRPDVIYSPFDHA
ncbi:regulatory protein, luxR family [Halopseudomonas litoralis]|uniref:Regulatory protein, luxR family n=1 Tax=Halopseudomonas litoralis TaxID=797277 RepID=A0A1H1QN77_9GAMM|nr:helix-turn-helix transcriptional regulator [Halopseudomonas litoralis]SDS24931.1 regulatory protein, luxR family [Halopseudomonas litoralis]